MPTRPTSVTVFGILNLCFAGMGFCGLLVAVAMLFVKLPAGNPMVDVINNNVLYGLWIKIGLGLGFIGNLMLLAAGIGLLKLRDWGRKLSMAYGILTILIGIVGTVINCTVLLPVMRMKWEESSREQEDEWCWVPCPNGAKHASPGQRPGYWQRK